MTSSLVISLFLTPRTRPTFFTHFRARMQQQCNTLLTKLQTHESYLYVFCELFVLTCEPVPLKDSTSLAGKKNKKNSSWSRMGIGSWAAQVFLINNVLYYHISQTSRPEKVITSAVLLSPVFIFLVFAWPTRLEGGRHLFPVWRFMNGLAWLRQTIKK